MLINQDSKAKKTQKKWEAASVQFLNVNIAADIFLSGWIVLKPPVL